MEKEVFCSRLKVLFSMTHDFQLGFMVVE